MINKILMSLIFTLAVSACGLEKYPSGDLPSETRLASIKTGDTKEKVLRVLGTPATESPWLSDKTSFLVYAQNLKESRVFLDPKETEREVYIYYFDQKDILKSTDHLTLADAQHISYDSEETPTTGRSLSIVDQLVQNFGRYNTGGQDSSVRH